MFELDTEMCTKDAQTCPETKKCRESVVYFRMMSELDPTLEENADMLDRIVSLCLKGTCPGSEPELTYELLRKQENSKRTD